jgi:hypothetical protein
MVPILLVLILVMAHLNANSKRSVQHSNFAHLGSLALVCSSIQAAAIVQEDMVATLRDLVC